MPTIYLKTRINEDADIVFNEICNSQSLVQYISGVNEIKVLKHDNNKKISKWEICINGTNIRWTEEQVINSFSKIISFRMIEGDYSQYDGEWIVREVEGKTQLELRFTIEWEMDSDDLALSKNLEKKARFAARWALRELRKKIGLGKAQSISSDTVGDVIFSTPIEFFNSKGKKIVAYHDQLESAKQEQPFIILIPGYGETKRESLLLSYYLVKNKFNVIRYDATNHVGESEGDIFKTTLSQIKDDLTSVIDFVAMKHGVDRVGVVASSLSQRVAIKAVAEDSRVGLLIGLVGVVSLQDTLLRIYQEDIIRDVSIGDVKSEYEVLGYVIHNNFPIDAIKHKFHNLDSTLEDVKAINIPIHLFCAENDSWINFADVQKVAQEFTRSESKLHIIPGAMHQLQENMTALKIVLKNVVVIASKTLRNHDLLINDVAEPRKRELSCQNRIEKERLRLQEAYDQDTEKEFWNKYLNKFTILTKVPEYKDYFSKIIDLFKINGNNPKILDAGCGNGYLGASLLLNGYTREIGSSSSASASEKTHKFQYYGVDRTKQIIELAKKGHQSLLYKYITEGMGAVSLPEFKYVEGDLNRPLPFDDSFFENICLSLVLSYLDRPLESLKELSRVLKPGGKMIVTSLKPSADLSEIYRSFVRLCESETDARAARELLNDAGQIKHKEGVGVYHFYSDKELKTILVASGFQNVRTYRAFSNQANIVIGTKSKPIKKTR